MRFANFVLGEPFSVKSSLRRPETEMDFALELEKFQGSIAEAAVLGSQKKWWEARSTVLVSLVTPPKAAPQSCFWHCGPFLGYSEWTVFFRRGKTN